MREQAIAFLKLRLMTAKQDINICKDLRLSALKDYETARSLSYIQAQYEGMADAIGAEIENLESVEAEPHVASARLFEFTPPQKLN
jgi:hypothetical protein